MTANVGKAVCRIDRYHADAAGFDHPRPLPQFDDGRMHRLKEAVEPPVRPQRVCKNIGIEAIVLGTSHCEAIPHPVELLRVDCMDLKASIHEMLDNGSMRNLDPDCDTARFLTADRPDPLDYLGQTLPAMRKRSVPQLLAISIQRVGVVCRRGPIHTDIGFDYFCHGVSFVAQTGSRETRRPCSGARRRYSPRGVDRGKSIGALVPSGRSRRWITRWLPMDWPAGQSLPPREKHRNRNRDHPSCTSRARKDGETGACTLLGREGGALFSRPDQAESPEAISIGAAEREDRHRDRRRPPAGSVRAANRAVREAARPECPFILLIFG